ncbi:MAG: fimbrial biogenesis chaperone [Rhizomicrobium sp.]
MRRPAKRLAAALTVLTQSAAASAGTIEIAPTTLDLQPGKAGLFYIANNGARAVTLQLQPMDWTQSGNANALAQSGTLIASPPFLRIAPHERQIVRVIADGAQQPEADYRLVVSELPDRTGVGSAVNVLLQFSIPVFVASTPVRADARWFAVARGGEIALSLHNDGGAALKITAISLARDGSASSPIPCGLIYILPGAQHVWKVPLADAASLRVSARDERSGTPLDADIAVQR